MEEDGRMKDTYLHEINLASRNWEGQHLSYTTIICEMGNPFAYHDLF